MSATLNQFLTPGEPATAPERGVAAYGGDEDELHAKLVRWFEEAERASIEPRQLSERDRDYYDHEQWTKPELDALNKRGQPPITINKIHDKVELLCGLERKARTDPKAFPRTPTEEERAEAATQALRYIDDDNNYPVIRSLVFNNMLVEGTGAIEHTLEDDGKGGADIRVSHVSWERLWWDPHSRALDFADARYRGLVIWVDRDQLDEMYPDADADVIDQSFAHVSGTYDDRPSAVSWTDTKRERCRLVQCHWSEKGEWWTATYSKGGILAPPAKSKFKDRRGQSACSLLMQSAYINRDNWRYGAVRGWISLQDEINKRRSKALHLLSVHQVIAEQGAVTDIDRARREVAKPDGYVEITPGLKFEIVPGGELASGQFQLLQHATAEMQLSGPNAAMSGTDSRELSGRAILAQQAGGAVQNEPLADSLRMFSRRAYEMWWMAAREMWAGGKWVRITDALADTRWVGINRAITLQDELAAMPEDRRAAVMQRMQPPLQPGDPRLQQVIRIENDITDLDVDIVIDEGQDIPTMAAENFQTLVQLAGMQPGLIPGDVLIAASSLRNKDDLLQRMKQHMEAQQQKEQQAAPLVQRHAEAEVAGKEAKAAADAALAKERNVNAVRGIHDVHAEFSAPPYGQPHVAPDAPSAPGTVLPMGAHASGGLVTRTLPAETWRGQLPGTYIDSAGQPQVTPVGPNFRAFGDPLNDTRDSAELDYSGFGHPVAGWPGGGWAPGGAYQMPPQNWPGPDRSHATGGLVRRNEPMPAPVTTLAPVPQGIGVIEPRPGATTGPTLTPQGTGVNELGPGGFGYSDKARIMRWQESLPPYALVDPNFREYGTGDAGQMAFIRRRLGLPDQLSAAGDPPLHPTPPDQLPPTADRNTLPPMYAPPSYWSPTQMRRDPTWPNPVEQQSHATGGPIAQMTGGDPPGPDDGYITAKAGEYVLNQGAVARYGQPLLDAINAGAIDPKVLEMAAGHAVADLRAKHAKAAIDEAKVGSEAARTNDLMHAAVLKVAQVRQMHHDMLHPPEPKTPQ